MLEIIDLKLKWLITILIVKKLGKRYVLGKLPGGRLMFLDKKTKQLVTIKTKTK